MAAIDESGVEILLLPKELRKLDSRERRWLWAHIFIDIQVSKNQIVYSDAPAHQQPDQYISHYYQSTENRTTNNESPGYFLPPNTHPAYININQPGNRDDDIANFFRVQSNPKEAIEIILNRMYKDLIPLENFAWIDPSNHRLLIWVINQLNKVYPSMKHLGDIPPCNRFDEIIFYFDDSKADQAKKLSHLTLLKSEWSQIFSNKKLSHLINEEDEAQLNWAWKYLYKHQQLLAGLNPTNQREAYIAILSSLDSLSFQHPAEERLFIDRMRKTWSQVKYRNSEKAKKQRSLPMSDKTKKQLDYITAAHEERINETLERIIREEYNRIKK